MGWIKTVDEAQALLARGEVIAYPTEAVYGLGCDPFNLTAVERVLTLKQRSPDAGFILLVADWTQVWPLIGDVPKDKLREVEKTWPGAVTWVFPKSDRVPSWITGQYQTVAIRMTSHPVARALCQEGPVVSTSANVSGTKPLRDAQAVEDSFPDVRILAGELGGALAPSAVYDVASGARLR